MEKILVLMSTYNGEKYIQEQLNSLYAQDGVEVSILVRDDGSTDLTKKILEENAEKHDISWYQGEHKNVQKSFFDLMQRAEKTDYDFFAFCDQDDVWDSDKLKIAIENIAHFDKPSLYYSGQRLVDENLNLIEYHRLNSHRTLKTRFVLSDFAGCTGVFNRALLDEVVTYEPNYMLMHDTWILRVCLCLGGEVIVDPEPRISYRQHSNNLVGLGRGIKSTVKQVDQYLNEYHIEQLTKELVQGYGDRMVSEYRELCLWICEYKKNRKYRARLLNKKNIYFHKWGLDITFWLKIKLRRL